MHFDHPTWLFALWLVPAIAWLLVVARRRRMATAARFADARMLARLTPTNSTTRSVVKATAVLFGLALLIVGAARPRWGVYFETVHAKGVDLFVLLDVSRSMLAEDVAPNRLVRAKSDIRDLLSKLVSDRVGLIVFAGAPVVKVPLTTDHAFLQSVLEEVDPTSAPRGGSLIGDAIRKAIESLGPKGDRDQVIVLITDGEDHDSYPTEAAKQASEQAIKIFTVGLGDTGEGRRVPIRDKTGNLTYLQHDGREVWSKMDEKLLKDIAVSTGGAYVPAKTLVYDLGEIYSQHLQKLTRGEFSSEKRRRYGDRYQLFVVAGLVLLLLDTLIPRFPSDKKRMNSTDEGASRSVGKTQSVKDVTRPLAAKDAVAFGLPLNEQRNVGSSRNSIAGLSVAFFLWSMTHPAPLVLADVAKDIRSGVASHLAGEFERAEKAFAEAAKQSPHHPVALYDRACALAAMGKLDEAEDLFQQSKSGDNPHLTTNSHYNLGYLDSTRAKAKFGDKPEDATPEVREEGMKFLEQAVMHYRDCLRLDHNHSAARHNLEVIRLWMKHMTDVWRQKDRDKARQELGLIEFLLMIEQRQSELLQTTKALSSEPASPRRRQAATAISQVQRELGDEIVPLQEKIRSSLQPPLPQQNGSATPAPLAAPDPQLEEAINQLNQQTQKIRSDMSQAAIGLGTSDVGSATTHQQSALDGLDEIYRTVAPFEHLLQRSIQTEESQVENTRPLTEMKPTSSSNAALPTEGDLISIQQRVTRWVETLGPRAAALLKQLEMQSSPAATNDTTDAKSAEADTAESGPDPEVLKAFYQKGIELGPKAAQAASLATELLTKKDWSPALGQEEEVVRLLKEIADATPKNPQDENKKPEQIPDEQKKQDPKKDDAQNKNQQDKQKQDKQQKQDKKKQDEKQEQDGSKKQEAQPKPGDENSKQQANDQPGKQPRSDPSREMAEALLRQVRQREREHKNREKELQAIIRGAVPVDKDW